MVSAFTKSRSTPVRLTDGSSAEALATVQSATNPVDVECELQTLSPEEARRLAVIHEWDAWEALSDEVFESWEDSQKTRR